MLASNISSQISLEEQVRTFAVKLSASIEQLAEISRDENDVCGVQH